MKSIFQIQRLNPGELEILTYGIFPSPSRDISIFEIYLRLRDIVRYRLKFEVNDIQSRDIYRHFAVVTIEELQIFNEFIFTCSLQKEEILAKNGIGASLVLTNKKQFNIKSKSIVLDFEIYNSNTSDIIKIDTDLCDILWTATT